MALKIDGGFKSPEGSTYFYSPALVLGLALTLVGLNGSEAEVVRLCEIHAFASYQKERKTCVTGLNRAFITKNVGVVKSAADKALNTLLARRILTQDGNGTFIINKWVDEWTDKNLRPVFFEGSPAITKMLATLGQRDWLRFPAAWFSKIAPRKATRQIPFQTSYEDNAESVPTSYEDNPNSDLTSYEDENDSDLTSYEDENTPNEDNRPARTPKNGAKTPPLEDHWLRFGSALSGDGESLADVAAFAEGNCREGHKVCEELTRYAGKFSHDHWVVAFQELANYPNPESLESPKALVLARVRNPKRARYQTPITLDSWLKKHTQPATDPQEKATAKAVYELEQHYPRDSQTSNEDKPHAGASENEILADQFMSRPSAEQAIGADQLRKATATDNEGNRRRIYGQRLGNWLKQGRPNWREEKTASARAGMVNAMAAGEQALRVFNERKGPREALTRQR